MRSDTTGKTLHARSLSTHVAIRSPEEKKKKKVARRVAQSVFENTPAPSQAEFGCGLPSPPTAARSTFESQPRTTGLRADRQQCRDPTEGCCRLLWVLAVERVVPLYLIDMTQHILRRSRVYQYKFRARVHHVFVPRLFCTRLVHMCVVRFVLGNLFVRGCPVQVH